MQFLVTQGHYLDKYKKIQYDISSPSYGTMLGKPINGQMLYMISSAS